MLFSKIWPPHIIEATEIKDWKTFSYEYAIDNGLNQLEAESFSDMISYFIGNGPAIPLENKYFKVQKIQFDILAAIPDIRMAHEDEKEQIKLLFDYVFIMYNEKIYQYTKKSEKVSFRLTKKQYDDFMSVPGKDKADKLQTLLSSYYPPTSCDDYEKISKEDYVRLGVSPHHGRTVQQEREIMEALNNGKKVLLVDKETLKNNLLGQFHVIYKGDEDEETEVRECSDCGEFMTEYHEYEDYSWSAEDYCNAGHDLEDTDPNTCKDYWDKI